MSGAAKWAAAGGWAKEAERREAASENKGSTEQKSGKNSIHSSRTIA
jgi:hypothetical protein